MSEVLAQLKKKGGGQRRRVTIATGEDSRTEKSFDVRSLLPNDYSRLTVDDFALVNVMIAYHSAGSASYSSMPTSYDAQNGVLYCGANYESASNWQMYIKYDVVCYL